MIAILFISFFLLIAIGFPIGFGLGVSSLIALLEHGRIPLQIIPQRFFTAMDSFPLMAVPFFMLAGHLMNSAGITKRIVRFSSSIVGHIRGGLAQVNILASMLFSGISGSASADASALGSMLIPAMVEDGYDADFSVAVTAASSTIGPIIPPSILMVIYGSMTGISIGTLFLAGIVPGILVGLSLMVTAYIISRKRGYKAQPRSSLKMIVKLFFETIVALLMPVIIIGGILSGIFTATEAGVVAVWYGLIVGFVMKEIKLTDLKDIFVDSAVMTSITLLLIAGASTFGWIITVEQLPQIASGYILSIANSPMVIMFIMIIALLIVGLFIEGLAALIILVPVMHPIALQFGFDPIHFAIVMVVILLIGAITPPVGLLLFISCSIAKISLAKASKAIWPFVVAMILIGLLIAYIPELVLFVPKLFMN